MRTGVYKLVWQSGHYYIGKSSDIDRRFIEHTKKMQNGNHSNVRVTRCYKKHGMPHLELLKECHEDDAYKVEREQINICREDHKMCLNFNINDKTGETVNITLQGRTSHKFRLGITVTKKQPIKNPRNNRLLLISGIQLTPTIHKLLSKLAKKQKISIEKLIYNDIIEKYK